MMGIQWECESIQLKTLYFQSKDIKLIKDLFILKVLNVIQD